MDYIATFHTHLAAMTTCRRLGKLGLTPRMAPVPRALSSSCGTCVHYAGAEPHLAAMDTDTEAVYAVDAAGAYQLLYQGQ